MDEIINSGINYLINTLRVYPIEDGNRRFKRIVKSLCGLGEPAPDRFFWPHAMMVNALMEYYKIIAECNHEDTEYEENETVKKGIINLLSKYYDSHLAEADSIKYPDTVMNGYSLFDLYEITCDDKYLKCIDKMADYLKDKAATSSDESILYRHRQEDMVYADTIGMICPVMFRYASMSDDKTLHKYALIQIDNYMANGFDNESGLPYHAYNSTSKEKYGIIGWGRAIGWIMTGIADSVEFVDDNTASGLMAYFKSVLEPVIKYQRPDGLFSWQLQAIDGPVDISATAMILGAVAKLCKAGLLDSKYVECCTKAYNTIIHSDGCYDKCLAECEALSCYPQKYGEYPWGTASVVQMLLRCKAVGEK